MIIKLLWIGVFATFLASCSAELPPKGESDGENVYAWMDRAPHDRGLWLTAQGRESYQSARREVLSLTPISVCDSATVRGEADALGYGVSNLWKGRLVVAHYARACHWGCEEKYPPGSSRAVVRYSDDYGETWSKSRYLDEELSAQVGPEAAIGWGLAFCQVADTTFLATSRGLFRSIDGGKDWAFVPGLRQGADYLPGTGYGAGKVHIGPRMIHTKRAGLLLFGQPERIQAGKLWVLQSLDGGRNWRQHVLETGRPDVTPVEPTAWKIDEDRLLFFSRNGRNGQGANPAQFILYAAGPGSFRIEDPAVSNCAVTGHQDTHDVIYNPFTDQFEATVSDRCTGPHNYNRMALSLWTIPAGRLLAGDSTWTYAGDYFPPMNGGADAEGTHPGGSVVDTVRRVQYLQVHRGHAHAGSSSLYQISRSLDTDAVSALLPKRAAGK